MDTSITYMNYESNHKFAKYNLEGNTNLSEKGIEKLRDAVGQDGSPMSVTHKNIVSNAKQSKNTSIYSWEQQRADFNYLRFLLNQPVDISQLSQLENIKSLILKMYSQKINVPNELSSNIETKVSAITKQILDSNDYYDNIKTQQIKDLFVGLEPLKNRDILQCKILSQLNNDQINDLFIAIEQLENSDILQRKILNQLNDDQIKDLFIAVAYENSDILQCKIINQLNNHQFKALFVALENSDILQNKNLSQLNDQKLVKLFVGVEKLENNDQFKALFTGIDSFKNNDILQHKILNQLNDQRLKVLFKALKNSDILQRKILSQLNEDRILGNQSQKTDTQNDENTSIKNAIIKNRITSWINLLIKHNKIDSLKDLFEKLKNYTNKEELMCIFYALTNKLKDFDQFDQIVVPQLSLKRSNINDPDKIDFKQWESVEILAYYDKCRTHPSSYEENKIFERLGSQIEDSDDEQKTSKIKNDNSPNDIDMSDDISDLSDDMPNDMSDDMSDDISDLSDDMPNDMSDDMSDLPDDKEISKETKKLLIEKYHLLHDYVSGRLNRSEYNGM